VRGPKKNKKRKAAPLGAMWNTPKITPMSKGNMLLGHARGKVGSLVFSRLNGQQIVRAKAEQVKNPRTDSQNAQRAIFATVNAFASAVRDVVDHSFQSVKEGQTSVNRFVSVNVKRLREAYLSGAAVDIMPKGEGLPYANAYRFSQGSLGLQRLFVGATGNFFAIYQESDWEGNIVDAAQMKAIIPAFKEGCEVAVIKVYYNETDHYHYVVKDRAVFLSSFEGLTGDIVTPNGINAQYLNPAKTTSNTVLRIVGGSTGVKSVAVTEDISSENANQLVACCVIVSQQDAAGAWLYTTSDMVTLPGWNEGHSTEDAVNSYGNTAGAEITSTEYLQQSSTADADAQQQISLEQTKRSIELTGAAVASYTAEGRVYTSDAETEAGAVAFTFNMPKNGNVVKTNEVQAIYYTVGEDGAITRNPDGVLNFSRSTAGNVVTVRGSITPRVEGTKLAGKLDINIITGGGMNATQIQFVPAT